MGKGEIALPPMVRWLLGSVRYVEVANLMPLEKMAGAVLEDYCAARTGTSLTWASLTALNLDVRRLAAFDCFHLDNRKLVISEIVKRITHVAHGLILSGQTHAVRPELAALILH